MPIALLAAAFSLHPALPQPVEVLRTFTTESVIVDADDPAIWKSSARANLWTIYGTDKGEGETGSIFVFDKTGKIMQRISQMDRPNNIDVEYHFRADKARFDVAVATERGKNRLRVFRIEPSSGKLHDVSGETACVDEPMGVGIYRQPRSGKTFAFVSPKSGPSEAYMAQYELVWNTESQKVDARLVRRFGKFSGLNEIEAVSVDDRRGRVYYSDEGFGTRQYSAEVADQGKEWNLFNLKGFLGEHEGIAVASGELGDWLICTDQVEENSIYYLYRGREPQTQPTAAFRMQCDSTDGIEVYSGYLDARFPHGIFIAMDSKRKAFAVSCWKSVLGEAGLLAPRRRFQ